MSSMQATVQATSALDADHQAPLYEIEGVTFEAEGRLLLQPLSFTFTPGRMIALIGHNGSGKSTLLKLLARQEAPSHGSLRFLGRAIGAWSARDFARRVAWLPQHPPPATGMSVRELVALGRYPWHGALGRLRKEDHTMIEEALRVTDTARFASQMTDQLSGGERQRAWLAMLVAQGASCLLLDEPTSALDIAHQIDVLRLLRRLADEHGLTIVIVLHDINLAARFCDDLVALHGGRLLTSGTPAQLMQSQVLEAIYGVPMDIVPHPQGSGMIAVAR
jgi:ferric hydroxamate transport system ATP-binding protein